MSKKLYLVIVVCVFLIAFFVRFHNLGNLPNGLQQDETSIGYNASSILQTGKDEYGQPYPLYFKAFGEYKLPLYIYSSALSIKIFGLNEFAVRFPSALFGVLTVVAFFFLVKQFVKKDEKVIPLVATGLLAINPWHVHFSRGAFEVTEALFFITFAVLLFFKSLRTKSSYLLPLSATFLIASMYTYNIARLFAPLLACFLLYVYRQDIKPQSKFSLYGTLGVIVALLLPFISLFFSKGGLPSTTGTLLFTSAETQSALLELRTYTIDLPTIIGQVFYNKWILSAFQYIKNIVAYLSVDFLFLSGSTIGDVTNGHHTIGNIGMFYLFELPTIIAGIILAVKSKMKSLYIALMWIISVVLIASLTREAPYATRSLFLVVPLELLSAIGIVYILKKILKLKSLSKIISLVVIGGFIFYNIVYFTVSYTLRFPVAYASHWHSEDKALTQYLKDNQQNYDRIVIDKDSGLKYTSLLYYLSYSPEKFYGTVKRQADDSEGFSIVNSFGKYEFRKIDWPKDKNSEKTLFISGKNTLPEDASSLKIFHYPERTAVFADGQKIIQLPVSDVAYMVFTVK